MDLHIVQNWERQREYIAYISKIDDIKGSMPLYWYKGNGDNVAPLIVSADKLDATIVFTSNAKLETDKLEQNFDDAKVLNSLSPGIYLVDYVDNKVLAEIVDNSHTFDLTEFSIFPPNTSDKYTSTNMISLSSSGKWYRMFGRENTLSHLLYILGQINEVSIPDEDFTVNNFGFNLLVDLFRETYGLKHCTLHEINLASKSVKPSGSMKNYDVTTLSSIFVEATNDEDNLSGYVEVLTGTLNENSDIKVLPGGSILIPGRTNGVNLSDIIKGGTVPETNEYVYINIDIDAPGLDYVSIAKDKSLLIYYDSKITNPTDLYELFQSFRIEQLELLDVNDTGCWSKLDF